MFSTKCFDNQINSEDEILEEIEIDTPVMHSKVAENNNSSDFTLPSIRPRSTITIINNNPLISEEKIN